MVAKCVHRSTKPFAGVPVGACGAGIRVRKHAVRMAVEWAAEGWPPVGAAAAATPLWESER